MRLVVPALLALTILGPAVAAAQGVTLFRDRRLEGPSATFTEDVPDLGRTRFGARRASSIGVPEGCTAVLYDRAWYRGRSTTFREDDENLSNTEVGEDRAVSLRVRCGGGRWEPGDEPREDERERGSRRGATLFRDKDLEGPSETFDRDVPDLERTRFGARTASSIDVSSGCVAVLFERPGYRGRRTEFRERDNDLSNTQVGEDTVSSLRVRCR